MTHAIGPAAALGGHLLHLIVVGGAILLGAAVYAAGAITAPRPQPAPPRDAQPELGAISAPATSVASWAEAGSRVTARQIAFLGLCAAAGTHVAVMPDHLRQSWILGAFFAVAAVLQFGLAWRVLSRPRRAELSAALTFCLAIVVLWAFTRVVGVPFGPDHGATEAPGVLDLFATAAELITAAALLHSLRSEPLRMGATIAPAWCWARWSPLTRSLLLLTIVGVPLLTALCSRS